MFVCTGPSQSLGTDAGFGTRACARPEDGQRRLRLTPRRQEALGCCGGSHRGRRITLSWAGTVDADGVAGRGAGSPPRLRGPLLGLHRGDHGARSTPASAGTTLDTLTCSPSTPVHPRVGRDHRVGGRDAWSYLGSRPRRRGPLDALDVQLPAGRFTLASAGVFRCSSPGTATRSGGPRRRGVFRRPTLDVRGRIGGPRRRGGVPVRAVRTDSNGTWFPPTRGCSGDTGDQGPQGVVVPADARVFRCS